MAEPAPTPGKKGNWKRFLLGYFVAYVAVATLVNVFLGPPGMSSEFLDAYKQEYDRYLEITKSVPYKKWEQRPHLNPPDESLQAQIDFVDEFRALPAFQAEEDRRFWYSLILDFFNVFMVILLALRFARRPLVGFLDSSVAKIKAELDRARQARETADARLRAAEASIGRLPEEKAAVESQMLTRAEELRRETEALTEKSLELLRRETEDRLEHERALAVQAMKRELVEEAVSSIAERARAENGGREDAALVDDFVVQLEKTL